MQEEVLDFAANIDSEDKIHIIFLLKDGNLIYYLYNERKWLKSFIKKLDTQSNIYKYLNIYIINNEINIFYTYANLINQNIWTIEQLIGSKNNWTKIRVNTFLSEKLPNPYYIDYDNMGNIHLVFSAKEKSLNHVYYTFYNSFIKKWNQIPEKISSSNVNNLFPYLFVDSKSNVHIIWSSLNSKDYILNYKKFTPLGQDRYKWKEIKLPTISNLDFIPIALEDNRILKIIFIKNNKIHYLYSKDYGLSWFKSKNSYEINKDLWLLSYSSNSLDEYSIGKKNHLYCKINDKIIFYPDKSYKKNSPEKKKVNFEKGNNISESEEDLISEIYKLTKSISETINNIEKDIDLLKEAFKNSHNDQEKNNLMTKLSNFFK
ncbi:hypothetical protein [Anaerosalibacter bizertensis]|uniref:hypothetical protein n=1 Tax=Anaerosalibacter bizertensis TaxID=932217 RepID=UPI003514066B